ncbi:cryptochrome/photolyase family protein [Microvirga alba]|uniref:Deoxyribodipyrimidine photo-lyase n=1 Tax=Microvirga alba TaxID=2791025 RepID=A0A931BNJ7_9HYPH|nr:deoxyribodipyrimidine photo-lyase [Microvirga alba]MBF9234101.1 deoxyribodipyrimidine photo-lyase [Microvirga alba]
MAAPVLVWFRDDHRLADNPALAAAVASGAPILCFFIFDEISEGFRPLGGAARWWLHGSIEALDESLKRLGSKLILLQGAAESVIERIASETGASAIFWNRRYTAEEIAVDSAIKKSLTVRGIKAHSFNGRLLNEPWEITNQSGKPFQVFTPYSRAVGQRPVAAPLPAPQNLESGNWPSSILDEALSLAELHLEPVRPDWAGGFRNHWQRGESAALERLADFLDGGLKGYAENRDIPGVEGTTRLSPHLRFGEIGPRQIWHAIAHRRSHEPGLGRDAEKLLSEVVWREFAYQLLYQYPDLSRASHSRRFAHFPWSEDEKAFEAWQKGLTGYPMVDAGMRQLWRTGWMHNRVRMIVASFLIKHLLIDWRRGEAWFWDTLVDADPANNAFGWQWVAGSGPDSAPFHRIFNPVTQGEKFDPQGNYVKAFVPELANLPSAFIHKPWEAPPLVLRSAGITLGRTYPLPIVPHGPARERALEAFRRLRDEQLQQSSAERD